MRKWKTKHGLFSIKSRYVEGPGYTTTEITLENRNLPMKVEIVDLDQFQEDVEEY